jgi:hypothetical protein
MQWDLAPSGNVRVVFEQAPLAESRALPKNFASNGGQSIAGGCTDGTAGVLAIDQDPAAGENVTGGILYGHAVQRVQAFLENFGALECFDSHGATRAIER